MFSSMTRSSWIHLLRVGLLTAGCAACAGGLAPPAAPDVSPAEDTAGAAPLGAFLAGAAPGDHVELPAEGASPALAATLEQEYHAASGRPCRQLRLAVAGASPELRHACRDAQTGWRLLPPLSPRGHDGPPPS
jgi:hypothetical protein